MLLNPFIYATSAAYTTDMVRFFAIPGASGKIRLKVEKPADADGVMIRWKASAWASGDTKDTGTLVDTITDTSGYKDANEWYEVTGLTNGTAYYFKAFPYTGSSYNETIGSNETICKAGGLEVEYTFDSIDGTTVNDTSGNGRNATISNISTESLLVGNAGKGNGTNGEMTLPSEAAYDYENRTVYFVTMLNDVGGAAYSRRLMEIESSATSYGTVQVLVGNNSAYLNIGFATATEYNFTPSASSVYHICMKHTGTAMKTYINNSLVKSGTKNNTKTGDGTRKIFTKRFSGTSYSYADLDQLRIYSRELESYEQGNLYNGGNGC